MGTKAPGLARAESGARWPGCSMWGRLDRETLTVGFCFVDGSRVRISVKSRNEQEKNPLAPALTRQGARERGFATQHWAYAKKTGEWARCLLKRAGVARAETHVGAMH